jgi:hypothetical protein
MLQAPTIVLSLLLASAYAIAFHLWLGRSPRHMLVFWPAAVAGFAVCQAVGTILDPIPLAVGQVRIVEATLGAALALALAHWLTLGERQP